MSSIYEHLAKAHLKSESAKAEPERSSVRKNISYPKPPKFRFIKTLAFLSLLASFAAGAGMYYLYNQLSQEKQLRSSLEESYRSVAGAVHELKGQFGRAESELAKIKSDVAANAGSLQGFGSELERQKAGILSAQKKIDALEAHNREIEAAIEELKAIPVPEPVAEFAPLDDGTDRLESFVNETASVPAGTPSAETPVAETAPQAMPAPQVMTLNRDFNFVVLNLGTRDGMKMGDRFQVLQNGKTIATVEVEKLYENFSAATILEEKKKSAIKEGDLIHRA